MSPMAGSAAAVASTAPSVTQGLMGDSTARGPDNERENEVGLEALLRGLYERMCPRDPDYNVRLELVERINMLVASVPACKGAMPCHTTPLGWTEAQVRSVAEAEAEAEVEAEVTTAFATETCG
ncbi:unnamed protein product [Closterium sp. NIES-54]